MMTGIGRSRPTSRPDASTASSRKRRPTSPRAAAPWRSCSPRTATRRPGEDSERRDPPFLAGVSPTSSGCPEAGHGGLPCLAAGRLPPVAPLQEGGERSVERPCRAVPPRPRAIRRRHARMDLDRRPRRLRLADSPSWALWGTSGAAAPEACRPFAATAGASTVEEAGEGGGVPTLAVWGHLKTGRARLVA